MISKKMIKIVLTGPESTGKTTLAKQLAEYYQTSWVPEYARVYLNELDRPYEQEDLIHIAKGQIQMEQDRLSRANRFLFCDTAMLVLKVWSIVRYQNVDPFIATKLQERPYHFYLLCGTDVPWEEDPLREHPLERDMLLEHYRRELEQLQTPYSELWGDAQERLSKAVALINSHFPVNKVLNTIPLNP